MALPTLPSSWTHKHQHVEKQMMRMREQQKRFREQWENATNYYKDQTISNRIRTNLMSEGAYKKSMETYCSLDERNRKLAALHRRREKLRELLQKERNAQEAELRGLSVGNYSRLQDMQERTEELKSAREEKRKELATEKLYQHWRENNEHLRKVESDLHQQHVREAWGDQTERRMREKDAAAASDRKFANEYEEARVRGMERMRRKEEERVREEVERAKMLKQQMDDLKRREEAAALLKREEEQIRREEWELEKVQEERRKMAEQRKKTELQRFLHHQFRAQLRRRAQQIQEELEFDREILRRLEEEEQRSKEQQTARQMKAKEDVQWMKEVLEQQLKLEAKREAELDLVYREEGRRVWEQREKEWERENTRLGNEELHGQMTERKHEIQTRREKEEQEQERVKRNEQDYDAIMRDEEERMRQMGFTARRRPRSSRAAWE